MQRKISNHGLGLRSMESNLEFLFLAGFMKTVRSIRHAFPNFQATLECTLDADSGYGLELMDALEHLQQLSSQKLSALLPNTLRDVMKDDYVWVHCGHTTKSNANLITSWRRLTMLSMTWRGSGTNRIKLQCSPPTHRFSWWFREVSYFACPTRNSSILRSNFSGRRNADVFSSSVPTRHLALGTSVGASGLAWHSHSDM